MGDINVKNGHYRLNGVPVSLGGGGVTHPGGSNGQIQFNNNGVFGGNSGLTWNGTSLIARRISVGTSAVTALDGDLGVSRNSAPNTGAIYFGSNAHIYYDGLYFNLSKSLKVAGDVDITGHYRVNGVPISTGGGGESQTPWLSNIDANHHNLSNVKQLGIGLPATSNFPLTIASYAPDVAYGIYIASAGLNYGYFHQDASPEGQAGLALLNDAGALAVLFIGGSNNPNPFYRNNTIFNSSSKFSIFSGDSIHFYVNSFERMGIAHDGKVGVGIGDPAYALDVAGDVNITGHYRVNGVPISTGGGGGQNQTPWLSNINAAGHNLSGVGQLTAATGRFTGNDLTVDNYLIVGNSGLISGYSNLDISSSTGISLEALEHNRDISAIANRNVILVPMHSGSVGIRRTSIGFSSTYMLDVGGDINIHDPGHVGGFTFRINGVPISSGGGGSQWTDIAGGGIYYNGGNVGINRSAPAYRLEVGGDINVVSGTLRINGTPYTTWTGSIEGNGQIINNISALGIGAYGPQARLHINNFGALGMAIIQQFGSGLNNESSFICVDAQINVRFNTNSRNWSLTTLGSTQGVLAGHIGFRDDTAGGVYRLLLTPTGGLRLPSLPSSDPGVSGSLWYDPADGNRVKYSV